jgi:integrase
MAGQITKRGENTWYVRIFLGRDANGKRKYFNKTVHGTKKDAQKFLTAKLREKDLGVFIEPAAMSVDSFLDKWLKESAKQRLRENTFNSYQDMLRWHVREKIGAKRLCDLQGYDVQKLYNELTASGLSPRTVRYAHAILTSALKQAVKWQMIIRNPCENCDLPKKEKKEMKHLSREETARFLQVAKDDKWFPLFLIAVELGLRPEEYFALQWKDFDFENNVVSIRRAVIEKRGGGFYFSDVKTTSSVRSINISNAIVKALKTHRRSQLEERMKIGADYQNLDLVFASELGTPLMRRNLINRHFKPLLKKAELKNIRLYDLRHTTASLLLAANEHPKVVQERLGHSSVMITLDTYSHVSPTMQKAATEKLEKMLYGK